MDPIASSTYQHSKDKEGMIYVLLVSDRTTVEFSGTSNQLISFSLVSIFIHGSIICTGAKQKKHSRIPWYISQTMMKKIVFVLYAHYMLLFIIHLCAYYIFKQYVFHKIVHYDIHYFIYLIVFLNMVTVSLFSMWKM